MQKKKIPTYPTKKYRVGVQQSFFKDGLMVAAV